uniref:Branched-chain amino acid transport system substrate-binding protein n=1 Tax=Candidatus Kentrum sp. TC TaxID=2126339 RepID=A0A451A1M0_9GAMM|nr:MAG: branched-chain amino acid transport system substrate-binding protein [Candidatus Kentron sp. TC]
MVFKTINERQKRKPLDSWIKTYLGIFLFAAVFVAGCGNEHSEQTGNAAQDVVLGAVLPLTGEVASWGEDSSDGIQLAIEQANEMQDAYHFSVVFEDSKGSPADAVAGIRKLIAVDKVVGIIGDNVSGPTVAMVPFADRAQIPLISPSASSPKLSGMSRYFFRVYPSDTAEGSVMGETAANRLSLERVAILYVNNDFGTGLRDIFSSRFGELDGTISRAMGYNQDETDFRPYLTRLLDDEPQGIYLAGYYKDGGAILKQARELGIKAVFMGSTTHEDPELLKIAKDAAEGFIYPFSTGYDENNTAAAVTGFRSAFEKMYSKNPGLVAALGYDCARLLIEAVESIGLDSEKIRDYLAGVKEYQGASGEISFDLNGDVHKPVILKTVNNGRFVPWQPGK